MKKEDHIDRPMLRCYPFSLFKSTYFRPEIECSRNLNTVFCISAGNLDKNHGTVLESVLVNKIAVKSIGLQYLDGCVTATVLWTTAHYLCLLFITKTYRSGRVMATEAETDKGTAKSFVASIILRLVRICWYCGGDAAEKSSREQLCLMHNNDPHDVLALASPCAGPLWKNATPILADVCIFLKLLLPHAGNHRKRYLLIPKIMLTTVISCLKKYRYSTWPGIHIFFVVPAT